MSPAAIPIDKASVTFAVKPTTSTSSSPYHASSSENALRDEARYAAHNYHPLPVVFARALGTSVWDPEGKKYLDFLSAYSAVNQGHCHPELVKALTAQAGRLTLSSRAFYNDVFPAFAKAVTSTFGYDMVLPVNTGAEAVESAVKLARKWGYKVKGIPEDQAIVLAATQNFHGRTFAAISLSTDPESRTHYGPFVPNIGPRCPSSSNELKYNSVPDLEKALKAHGSRTAAFLVEPIQGEAGIVVPSPTYLAEVKALCEKHRVLLICDEIQTGIARTGKLLCYEHSGIRPDVVLLGKALSGGMYPVSAVLADKDVMLTIEPGTHGSTYGGNPLGCAVAMRALEIVKEEKLVERSEQLGKLLRRKLEELNNPMISLVRGMGLLNAIVIDESKTGGHSAWELCLLCKEKGLLAKPTHENIIRLAPPLVITEEEIDQAVEILRSAMEELPKVVGKVME
ncbi:MAG: ornithine aminotransferase [Vezdaea aestivalis]|nr:MAG: ornithine aminotransferase [Vezdaea aestivalis]